MNWITFLLSGHLPIQHLLNSVPKTRDYYNFIIFFLNHTIYIYNCTMSLRLLLFDCWNSFDFLWCASQFYVYASHIDWHECCISIIIILNEKECISFSVFELFRTLVMYDGPDCISSRDAICNQQKMKNK